MSFIYDDQPHSYLLDIFDGEGSDHLTTNTCPHPECRAEAAATVVRRGDGTPIAVLCSVCGRLAEVDSEEDLK